MTEYEIDIINYAKKIAITSFIIGSLIFLAFLILNVESIAAFGFLFALFAILANGMTLIQLVFLWVFRKSKRVIFGKVILLVLANIPIALIFIKITRYVYNYRFVF